MSDFYDPQPTIEQPMHDVGVQPHCPLNDVHMHA